MNDTKEKPRTDKARKFLFDLNCFDDGYEEEVIPEEPPPPVFSEQELESVRKEAYERGRREALAEAEASREKQVAELLGTIGRHFETLFDAEKQRQSQYESEAVLVAQSIFEKLFPAMNAQGGLAEIGAVLTETLESRKDSDEIVIEVHMDYCGDIEKRLAETAAALPSGGKITVRGNETLGPGDCRMNWNDGGAQRDITGLAEEIHRQIEHMLAGKPALQDNRDEEDCRKEDAEGHKTDGEGQ